MSMTFTRSHPTEPERKFTSTAVASHFKRSPSSIEHDFNSGKVKELQLGKYTYKQNEKLADHPIHKVRKSQEERAHDDETSEDKYQNCHSCYGSGTHSKAKDGKCPTCKGKKRVPRRYDGTGEEVVHKAKAKLAPGEAARQDDDKWKKVPPTREAEKAGSPFTDIQKENKFKYRPEEFGNEPARKAASQKGPSSSSGKPCPHCEGTGKRQTNKRRVGPAEDCSVCNGTGKVPASYKMKTELTHAKGYDRNLMTTPIKKARESQEDIDRDTQEEHNGPRERRKKHPYGNVNSKKNLHPHDPNFDPGDEGPTKKAAGEEHPKGSKERSEAKAKADKEHKWIKHINTNDPPYERKDWEEEEYPTKKAKACMKCPHCHKEIKDEGPIKEAAGDMSRKVPADEAESEWTGKPAGTKPIPPKAPPAKPEGAIGGKGPGNMKDRLRYQAYKPAQDGDFTYDEMTQEAKDTYRGGFREV